MFGIHIESIANFTSMSAAVDLRIPTNACTYQMKSQKHAQDQSLDQAKNPKFDMICFQRAEMKLLVCFNPMLIKTYLHLRNGCGEQNKRASFGGGGSAAERKLRNRRRSIDGKKEKKGARPSS